MSVWSKVAGLASAAISTFLKAPVDKQKNDVTKAIGLIETVVVDIKAAWEAPTLQAELAAGLGAADALAKIAAELYPPAALAEIPIEVMQALIPVLMKGLTLHRDGKGGWYSDRWAEDPRHKLNPDGTFVDPHIF